MKPFKLFLSILICSWCFSSVSIAQNPEHLFKVVMVKGNPTTDHKIQIRDGQKMQDKDQVVFTSINDVVILLNMHFDKIRMSPKTSSDLGKRIKIQDYMASNNPKSPVSQTRGMSKVYQFESIADTLKLHLVSDLHNKPDTPIQSFKLLNQQMEQLEGCTQLNGQYLLIYPSKNGSFSLYFNQPFGKSELHSDVEFIDKNEVNAELKFIASSAISKYSISTQLLSYLRKQYPHIPESQLNALNLN